MGASSHSRSSAKSFAVCGQIRGPCQNASRHRGKSQPDIVKAKLKDSGCRVTGTSPDDLASLISAGTVKWGKAVAPTGFKAD